MKSCLLLVQNVASFIVGYKLSLTESQLITAAVLYYLRITMSITIHMYMYTCTCMYNVHVHVCFVFFNTQ